MMKEKILTVRLSESQYDELAKEAESAGYKSLSGYVREKLTEKPKANNMSDIRNKSLAELNPDLSVNVNKALIRLNYNIERLPDNKKNCKNLMKDEVMMLWHMLN